MIPVAAG